MFMKAGVTAAIKMAQWGGAGAVAGAVGASAVSDPYSMQDIMMDSGSLNVDDGDLQMDEAPDLINEPNYIPEQSMNLSKLLMEDDENLYDADIAQTIAPQGPGLAEMAAPVAVSGGIHAMRAVYNRLRGMQDDDMDEDTPGVQELMSQMPPGQTAPKSIPEGSRWAQMQQSMNHSVAQESTRGTTGFFMQTNA